ncbi:MAG TPA: hypothetical protein VHN77_13980 [Phycisphaerales bacterium]|nr:hypothetical protein [Phycisphaerales bacterium]
MSDTRRRQFDEDANDPRAEDVEQFSGVTRTCPECKAEVYDEAELCWKCGHAFSGEPKGMPGWVTWVSVAVVAAVLFAVLRWVL